MSESCAVTFRGQVPGFPTLSRVASPTAAVDAANLHVVGDFNAVDGLWCAGDSTGGADWMAECTFERRTRLLDNDGDGVYEATVDLPKMEVKGATARRTRRGGGWRRRGGAAGAVERGLQRPGGAPLVSSYMLNWDDSCHRRPHPQHPGQVLESVWGPPASAAAASSCCRLSAGIPPGALNGAPSPPQPPPPSTPPPPPPSPPAPPAPPPSFRESGGKAVAEPDAAAVTAGAAIGTVAVAAAVAAVAAATGAVAAAADAAVASVAAAGDAAVAAATAGAADVARQADAPPAPPYAPSDAAKSASHRKLPSRRTWRS